MATKVDKRQVRKELYASELGENRKPTEKKDYKVEKQKRKESTSFWSTELGKWTIFGIQILLLIFIFTFGKQA